MLIRMEPCKPVTADYFDEARDSFTYSIDLDATPETIFAVFEDPESWPKWVDAITRVTWTSPKPFGVGTTRTVDMMGGLSAYEYFFEWEQNKGFAFYFQGTNKPMLNAFAEQYKLEPLENGKTRFTWRVAFESRGFMRHVSPILRPFVRIMLGRIVSGLGKYLRDLPATASGSTNAETTQETPAVSL